MESNLVIEVIRGPADAVQEVHPQEQSNNPLIMKKMASRVPDAGAYAPVTVLVDEQTDGVLLSYDRMVAVASHRVGHLAKGLIVWED